MQAKPSLIASSEVDMQELVRFLRGNVRLLMAGLVIGALVGLVFAMAQTPKYQSKMTLQFNDAKSSATSIDAMLGVDKGSSISTAIPILTSRTLAVDVVNKLALNAELTNVSDLGFFTILQRKLWQWINPPPSLDYVGWSGKARYYLAKLVGDPGPVGFLEIRDIFVDPHLRTRELTLELVPAGIEVMDEKGRSVASCREGELCRLPLQEEHEVHFFLKKVFPGYHTTIMLKFRSADQAASLVRQNLTIKTMGQRRSNFLTVGIRWPDRFQAEAILKALASVYIERDQHEATRSYDQMIRFLDENLEPMEDTLETAEKKLRAFLNEHNILDMSENISRGLEVVAGLEQQRLENEQNIASLTYLADALHKADPIAYGPLVSEVSEDLAKEWEQLQQRSAELDVEKEALSGFSEEYPRMKQHLLAVELLDKRKGELKKKALQAIQDKRKLLEKKNTANLTVRDNMVKRMGLDSETQNQYLKLARNKAVAEKLFGLLLEKREEMRISKAGELVGMQVLDVPLTGHQVTPNLPRSSIMGALLGLMAFGFVAFMRQRLDVAIRNPEEIEHIGLYVHGLIPVHKEAEENVGLVTIMRPSSVDAEAYRSLRTSIQLSSLENQVRSIMITSSGPGEGKSTTMCNLAVTLAHAGLKTLVVDCDMRRPVVNTYLDVEGEPGLSEILEGNLDWHDHVRTTSVDGLFAVPAGSIPSNPSELIGRKHMGDVLAEMKQEYDFVLCDVPPILVVSDAALLASHLDGVLILVRSGVAQVQEVSRAREQMERIGGKVLGCIFNGFSGDAGYGYGGYGGYGRYSGYYQQESEGEVSESLLKGMLTQFTSVARKLVARDKS